MAATKINVQVVRDSIANANKQISEQESALGDIDSSINSMQGKSKCKKALQKELGLSEDCSKPLFAVISRLTDQKGMDLITYNLPWIVEQGAQLVVLGQGEERYVEAFRYFESL